MISARRSGAVASSNLPPLENRDRRHDEAIQFFNGLPGKLRHRALPLVWKTTPGATTQSRRDPIVTFLIIIISVYSRSVNSSAINNQRNTNVMIIFFGIIPRGCCELITIPGKKSLYVYSSLASRPGISHRNKCGGKHLRRGFDPVHWSGSILWSGCQDHKLTPSTASASNKPVGPHKRPVDQKRKDRQSDDMIGRKMIPRIRVGHKESPLPSGLFEIAEQFSKVFGLQRVGYTPVG